jgi:hypothetical protein
MEPKAMEQLPLESDSQEDLSRPKTNPSNWRLSVREQIKLHQALLRRRIEPAADNETENALVFIESADDQSPLFFAQAAEYKPLSDPSTDRATA